MEMSYILIELNIDGQRWFFSFTVVCRATHTYCIGSERVYLRWELISSLCGPLSINGQFSHITLLDLHLFLSSSRFLVFNHLFLSLSSQDCCEDANAKHCIDSFIHNKLCKQILHKVDIKILKYPSSHSSNLLSSLESQESWSLLFKYVNYFIWLENSPNFFFFLMLMYKLYLQTQFYWLGRLNNVLPIKGGLLQWMANFNKLISHGGHF